MLYWKPPTSRPSTTASGEAAAVAAAGAVAAAQVGGVVSLLPRVVSIANASDITFSGIALLHARANGVDVVRSTGVVLSDCVLANHGEKTVL